MASDSRVSRRKFIQMVGAAGSVLSIPAAIQAAGPRPKSAPNADDVLRKLLDGNKRFVAGKDTAAQKQRSPQRRKEIAEGQNPLAAIVACADSRVAPELLFDQGLGDLFVIRVAGNVVSGAGAVVKGSIEYAVAELDVPLIMVLGHSKCGAVKAALQHCDAHDKLPGAIQELVNLIKPVVAQVKDLKGNRLENAIQANVARGVAKLMTLQPIVAPRVKKGRLKVVGATYDLVSGKVTLLG
jgi:carbonic anhydrase